MNIKLLYIHEISEVVKFHVVYGGITRTLLLNFARAIPLLNFARAIANITPFIH